jgi:hypothetical protein
MIRTRERLISYIQEVLKRQEMCRVFSHVISACWNVPRENLDEEIAAFAALHRWEVKVHEPAAYGIVADFKRAEPDPG